VVKEAIEREARVTQVLADASPERVDQAI